MSPQLRNILAPMLRTHEDKKQFPYDDKTGTVAVLETGGKITIGIGRNLSDRGLSEDEIYYLFDNDLRAAETSARLLFPEFDSLTLNRQAVVLNMSFNLGLLRLSLFKNMIRHIRQKQFDEAAADMRDSQWFKQVGHRGVELANMMERG